MKNIKLIIILAFCVSLTACGQNEKKSNNESLMTTAKEVAVTKSTGDPVRADTITVGKVVKTEAEWRKILPPDEFHILREAGTEPAFRNAFYDNKKEGIYSCGACKLPLYSSYTKFDSGTGWPSFYAPIDKKLVKRKVDKRYGMERVEVICAQCNSHLGHIFPYKGVPTEERHCLNSLALNFEQKQLKK
jgi:peptide-methionine (R)-S-oxide reductase